MSDTQGPLTGGAQEPHTWWHDCDGCPGHKVAEWDDQLPWLDDSLDA